MSKSKKNHAIELEFQKDNLDLKMFGPFGLNSRLSIVTSIASIRGYACFFKIFTANSAIMLVSAFLYRAAICDISKLSASADTSIILLQVVIGIKYITGTLIFLPCQWAFKQACAAFIAADLFVLVFAGSFNLPLILSLSIFVFQVMIALMGSGSRNKGAPAINLIKTIQPVISFPQNKLVKA